MSYNFWLAVSIIFFAIIHSLTASNTFKKRVRWFTRIHYNILSIVTILPVTLFWARGHRVSDTIFSVGYPANILFYLTMALGALITVSGAKELDLLEFFGLHKSKEKGVLAQKGVYGMVRHPLYLGVIMFIWFYPALKVIDLVGNTGFTVYLIIGAYLEEKKLILEFGDEYREYRKKTPMLIPRLHLKH